MWDLPGPELEPTSPALAGGFLTLRHQGSTPHTFWDYISSAPILDEMVYSWLHVSPFSKAGLANFSYHPLPYLSLITLIWEHGMRALGLPAPMKVNAGPWESLQAAKLHTQHRACNSFWVLWKHLGLMTPLFCKRIIAEVKWLAPVSLGNSAAAPEIESCPAFLTAWQELKTLPTFGAGERSYPWSPCPRKNTEAHLVSEVIMALETWGVLASPSNPAQFWKQPKEGGARWATGSAGRCICSAGARSGVPRGNWNCWWGQGSPGMRSGCGKKVRDATLRFCPLTEWFTVQRCWLQRVAAQPLAGAEVQSSWVW